MSLAGNEGDSADRRDRRLWFPPRNFSPEFWDDLPIMVPTRRSLRECDRRNYATRNPPYERPELIATTLARFARRGGPDLRHLRGYSAAGRNRSLIHKRTSKIYESPRTRPPYPPTAPDRTPRVHLMSAFNRNFEDHLAHNDIYLEGYEYPHEASIPELANEDHLRTQIRVERASAHKVFTEAKFVKLQGNNEHETTRAGFVRMVMSAATGQPTEGGLQFENMAPLTTEITMDRTPAYYEGSDPNSIHDVVEKDLNRFIIPTTEDEDEEILAVPNFFFEAGRPPLYDREIKCRACYFGAQGARAMHMLHNYKKEEPVYDANAYTFSATYNGGRLHVYAHYVTAPTTEGGNLVYHMTNLGSFDLAHNFEDSVFGINVLRNVRELARTYREKAIEIATGVALKAA